MGRIQSTSIPTPFPPLEAGSLCLREAECRGVRLGHPAPCRVTDIGSESKAPIALAAPPSALHTWDTGTHPAACCARIEDGRRFLLTGFLSLRFHRCRADADDAAFVSWLASSVSHVEQGVPSGAASHARPKCGGHGSSKLTFLPEPLGRFACGRRVLKQRQSDAWLSLPAPECGHRVRHSSWRSFCKAGRPSTLAQRRHRRK